ncbi:hypothetical protein BOX15_Mlig031317g1, partial [Macrostomum lignano]
GVCLSRFCNARLHCTERPSSRPSAPAVLRADRPLRLCEQRLEAALELKQLAAQPGTADCFLADLGLLDALLAAATQAVDAVANSASHLESSLFAALAGLMSSQADLIHAFLHWTSALPGGGGPAALMAVKFASAWLLKSPGLARRCPLGSRQVLLTAALRLLRSAPSVRFAIQLLALAEAAVTAPLGGHRVAGCEAAATSGEDDDAQIDNHGFGSGGCIGDDPGADDVDDPLTGILAFLAEQLRLPRTQHCLRLRAVELASLSARRGASRRQLASGVWPVLREGLRPRRGQLDADLAELAAAGLSDCSGQLRLAGVDEVTPVLIEFVTCGGTDAASADGLASAQLVAMTTADKLLEAESPACAAVWVFNSCIQLLRWCLARRAALSRCPERLCLAISLLDRLLQLAEPPVPPTFAKDARTLLRQLDCEANQAAAEGAAASGPSPACSLLSLTGRLRLLPLSPASERTGEAELLTSCLCRLLAWAPGHCQGRRLLPRLRLALSGFVDAAADAAEAVSSATNPADVAEFTGGHLARVWLAYAECRRRAACLGWLEELASGQVDEDSLVANCWQLMELQLPVRTEFDFRLQPFAALAEALDRSDVRLAKAALSHAARAGALDVFFGCESRLRELTAEPQRLLLSAGLLLESVCARHPDRRRPLRCLDLLLEDVQLRQRLCAHSADAYEGVIEVVSGGVGLGAEDRDEFHFEDVEFENWDNFGSSPTVLGGVGRPAPDSELAEFGLFAALTGLGYWLCLADRLRRDPADLLEASPGLSLSRLHSAANQLAATVGQVAEADRRFVAACAAQPESALFATRGLCRLRRSAFADAVLRRLAGDSGADRLLDDVLDCELASPLRGRRLPAGLSRAAWLAFLARPECPIAAGRLARLLADPAGPGPDRRLFGRLADLLRLRPAALAAIGRLLCDLLDNLAPVSTGGPLSSTAVGSVSDLAFLCTACLPAEPFPALLNRCLAWLKCSLPSRRFDCLRLGLLLEPRVAGLLRRCGRRPYVGEDDSDELRRLLAELLQVSVATWKAAELREPAALQRLETAVLMCASAGLLPQTEA